MFINEANGSIYEGFRVKGRRQGPGYYVELANITLVDGKYPISNFLIYEGNWDNNQPHDKGIMHFPNGDIYCGDFEKG